ncbi:MAG TPA: serine hydrolase domain-containing protein [Steroidobacteraceae bacterium]|nr:serine hydrolase domain-containing protein [Steroidobacteraceae bacterium]
MRRPAALLLLLAAVWGFTSASSAQAPRYTPAGLEAIQTLIDGAVRSGRIPSAIAMLAHDGRIAWLHTAGEMGPGVPMSDDAIIPLASVGKMHTAVAAMMLVEDDVLSLDDPVGRFIPEFTRLSPEVPITVRHLLTHTAGLTVSGDEFWEVWDAHSGRTTTTEFSRALAALPLQSRPGEKFDYGQTGASYEVLGAVIEIASGRTLQAFMTERLFEPLGLRDTHFHLPEPKRARRPAFFRHVDGALKPERPMGEDAPRSNYFHGGGGVQSSARDIARFSRLFLDGGAVDGVRILAPATIAMMMSDQIGALTPFPGGLSWGLGAAVRTEPDGTVTQYGWSGGGYATLIIDPVGRTTAYFAFPVMPPGDNALLTEFRRLVREAKAPAAAGGT